MISIMEKQDSSVIMVRVDDKYRAKSLSNNGWSCAKHTETVNRYLKHTAIYWECTTTQDDYNEVREYE